jgi:hypothetical protein
MFSVRDFCDKNVSWRRFGNNISYYNNSIPFPGSSSKTFFTATFSVTFEHNNDDCFLAYHYPYSYSCLRAFLSQISGRLHQNCIRSALCRTFGGNECDILTITSFAKEDLRKWPLHLRPYVVVSARVHPGETNSSWIMHGVYLMGEGRKGY